MTLPDEIAVVTETAEAYLNPKQLVDYRSEREACLSWLLAFGKKPDRGQGYALGTVKPRAYRMDKFYHPPPNATSDDAAVEAPCISVTELALVARAVHHLWRMGYDTGTTEPLNDATNPP